MMRHRTLVTAGCSFSECVRFDADHKISSYNQGRDSWKTWPIFLKNRLAIDEHYSEAMGSQGNGLISRRVQHRVHQLLKDHAASDILVCVMWSGRDRFDFFFETPIEFTTNQDGWIENPTRVADGATGGWVILNANWTHQYNRPWYEHYYNDTAAHIYTLEHIVHCQNFLDLQGVDYVFTMSYNWVVDETFKNESNCAHLWEQIRWDRFLPVKSEYHWVEEHYPRPPGSLFHPEPWQHEKFVDEVMIPYIQAI